MTDKELLYRITSSPKVLAGKPVVRGTRLAVDFVLNLLAHGSTAEEIIDEYNGLTVDDIRACLLFASRTVGSSSFMPLTAESQ